MTRKQHIVLAALFIAVNLFGAFANTTIEEHQERALDATHYEDATAAELAAADVDPIVCVASSTESGCG
jgi:hypothetical protein